MSCSLTSRQVLCWRIMSYQTVGTARQASMLPLGLHDPACSPPATLRRMDSAHSSYRVRDLRGIAQFEWETKHRNLYRYECSSCMCPHRTYPEQPGLAVHAECPMSTAAPS